VNYDYLIPLVKRWVAGKTLDEALIVARQANMKGYYVVLNYLGEEITDEKQIRHTVLEYKKIIDVIRREKINAAIALKLTQLGLSLNESLCEDNLNEIVKYAKNNKLTVWIDMENSKYTDKTIKIYLEFLKEYDEIGVAIQAYLKRGFELAKLVAANDGMIRLVKGAYKEPSSIVYTSKEEINRNFNEIMQYLFEKRIRLELGTHDEKLVYNAIKLILKTKHNIEFAFLRGIRNDLKSWLVKEGFKVVEYIPYGPSWKDYVYRRIREKRSNILLALTSIFTK
jgi:proline dehydrogenase